MENVILTVHLILAATLVGIVLLQRSEGGGLGMGGGGGGAGGGVMSGRAAANALSRLTWILGVAIFATSITLTILAARQASNSSIMDQFGGTAGQQQPAGSLPGLPAYTPPPTTSGNPLVPPSPDAPDAGAVETAPAGSGAADPVTPPATEAAPVTETPAVEAPATAAPEAAAPEAVAPPAPEAEAVTPPAASPPAPAEPAAPAATN
ncbi:preprotein translocase subunit SecG [Paracoccus gahaiensis]|uniref:Protein-export membrane protein SecG n=1 Tax=Paracoccus gahaiensis TaxID=1706839 RepID=A0A4U0R669_9RHOB|nr:preprotein translocase subunit SecG [Paracoccus gahaiensis]TJZ90439.1 preprotein translocase subunit SecG [Paracoccus gahaiensis]